MRISDWSSDVCSSDLQVVILVGQFLEDVILQVRPRGDDQQVEQGMQRSARAEARLIAAVIVILQEQEFESQEGSHPLTERLFENQICGDDLAHNEIMDGSILIVTDFTLCGKRRPAESCAPPEASCS